MDDPRYIPLNLFAKILVPELQLPPVPYYSNQAFDYDTDVYGSQPVQLTKDGQILFYCDPPRGGEKEVLLLSSFDVDAMNLASEQQIVKALIGVGTPSENNNPMNPFTALTHPWCAIVIESGGMQHLHVSRADVVDRSKLDTVLPWELNVNDDGAFPRLAMQVYGPTDGTIELYNASAYCVLIRI